MRRRTTVSQNVLQIYGFEDLSSVEVSFRMFLLNSIEWMFKLRDTKSDLGTEKVLHVGRTELHTGH